MHPVGSVVPQWDRRLTWLLAALVSAFAFSFAVEKVYNYDIWWHLRTGELILETGRIPTSDTLSYTTAGAEWVPHYWLSDLVFAGIERTIGLSGLILFKATIVALAFLTAYRLMIREQVNPFLAAFVLGLAVSIARFRFLLRPGVFFLLMASIFFALCTTWSRDRPKRLLILVPLTALWANLHASFVIGLLLLGCRLAEELFHWGLARIRRGTRDRGPALLLGTVLLLALSVTLVNPFGIHLHQWIFADFFQKSVARSFEIQEHLPLRWGEHKAFWALMAATAISFPLARQSIRPLFVLVFFASSYLALSSVRYVAIAALLQGPILGINLQALLRRIGSPAQWLGPRMQIALFVPLLLLAGALTFRSSFSEAKVYRFGLGINESRYPEDALRYLEGTGIRGNLFNSWQFGGYVMWRMPERKVFIDGRCLEDQLRFFTSVSGYSPQEFERMIDEFDITAALVERGDSGFLERFRSSPRFATVFFDDRSLVFVRSDDAGTAPDDERRAFRIIRPESYDYRYLAPLAKGPLAQAAEAELRRAVALSPESFKPRFELGFFLEAKGDPEALDQYFEAARANPRLAFTHYHLGIRAARLALARGQPERAKEILEQSRPFGMDAESHFILGTALYVRGDLAGAEEALRQSLDLAPEAMQPRLNLAYLLLDSGRLEESETQFRAVRRDFPANQEALYGLALSLHRAKRSDEATRLFRQFLREFPDSEWTDRVRQLLAEAESAP